MPKRKTDPLLAALIAKLPQTGTEWPADQQKAWLANMQMAFSLVYGGPLQANLNLAPTPVRPKKPTHPFIIDKQGYVKRGSGERIMPKDVDAPIWDERGEDGDLRSITWADDSKGLNGRDLMIHG